MLKISLAEWKPGVIGKLPQPQHGFGLFLSYTKVTDAGLKELAGLKSLQSLYFALTPVTDTGLKELAGLDTLRVLPLSGTTVTGVELKHLAGLKSLQYLALTGTGVTAFPWPIMLCNAYLRFSERKKK